ncbi:endonuclease/exonuclease/phosphatase family protein [Streptomyces sp. enrichment culture]|uniref:endonuclease/exonuclease/phosphatase family protein n=1 Tax=Streptomyces sp. enrichment culture TaxID=1795815 RepID=UPI003F5432B7
MTTPSALAAVPGKRPRGILTTTCAVLLAVVLARPGWIPAAPGHLGSLTDTMLPWTALALPPLLAAALLRRSRTALTAVALPLALWPAAFGGTLTDKSAPGGDLTVVSHNVNQDNPDPQDTARRLLAAHADILALEELSPETAPAYERALAPAYRHHFRQGTVGVWSVYPLRDAHGLPIMPWSRALRATAETPHGPLTVYVAHLPSVRVHPTAGFTTAARDEALRRLTTHIRAEDAPRSLLMGDLNGSADDRALRPLTSRLASAQETAGAGFGFTWPSGFPVVRIDQILVGGVRATSAWTLPATRSDHLPVAATISF